MDFVVINRLKRHSLIGKNHLSMASISRCTHNKFKPKLLASPYFALRSSVICIAEYIPLTSILYLLLGPVPHTTPAWLEPHNTLAWLEPMHVLKTRNFILYSLRVQNEQFSEEKGFILCYTEKEV